MSTQDWFVYIIQTDNGNLYTGITTDIHRRWEEHQNSPKAAKFFKSSKPKEIVYLEITDSRSTALKREAAIKKLKRPEKIKLLSANCNKLSILM